MAGAGRVNDPEGHMATNAFMRNAGTVARQCRGQAVSSSQNMRRRAGKAKGGSAVCGGSAVVAARAARAGARCAQSAARRASRVPALRVQVRPPFVVTRPIVIFPREERARHALSQPPHREADSDVSPLRDVPLALYLPPSRTAMQLWYGAVPPVRDIFRRARRAR